MDGTAIMTVSMAVLLLTQLVKWSGAPRQVAPLVVVALSLLGVVIWAVSVGSFTRAQLFDYFAGWITVAASAAGAFGFVRERPENVMAVRKSKDTAEEG